MTEIWLYVAIEASEATATRLIHAVQTDCERLLSFPNSGPAREQLAPGLRAIFHGAYVIYYRIEDPDVVLVRVLHGARDQAAMADGGAFE